MTYFSHRNNNNIEHLFVENVAISDIAAKVGTPFYCYSKQALVDNFNNFNNSFTQAGLEDYKICYAIKANANINLVKVLTNLGSGIDAVSAGEIFRAIKAGANPKKIVFAGVGKTKEEMTYALQNGVEEFSVESVPEMILLNEVALELGAKAKFSLRVNPNVDANTHDKISTGRKGDKFGVDIDQAPEIYNMAAKLEGLQIYGISTHIGSQITEIEPFKLAFEKLRQLCLDLREQGHNIESLDFGGGIGINYKNETLLEISQYAKLLKDLTHDLNVKITIAPGRSLVGNAGILVTQVIFIKETAVKNFAIIDAAMNDLMRPGLYDAYHEVLPVKNKIGSKNTYDLAGPICETTDILAKSRQFSDLAAKDLLAIKSAGAYGSTMSNEYNARALIPEVLVDDNNFKIIRRRPTFDEMIRFEK